jgi:hypothetical protein
MSNFAHWFWTLLTAACLIWYLTVTILVAYLGAIDIREMLIRLRSGPPEGQ